MNSIEEQLWAYIDGTCTPDEHAQLTHLISHNEEYKRQYEELLQLNSEFAAIELDEPPMAFTYNVMEQIRTQEASVPLKAAINSKIIWGVVAFFVLTILIIMGYTLTGIKWETTATTFKAPVKINMPEVSSYFTGPWMKGFLFFDLVVGLFLLDGYLRKLGRAKTSENF